MVHWTFLIVAFIFGEIIGIAVAAICAGNKKDMLADGVVTTGTGSGGGGPTVTIIPEQTVKVEKEQNGR